MRIPEYIYTMSTVAGENFKYVDEHNRGNLRYKLVSGLLMVNVNFFKILLPPSMIGL
jgi:hypothetical protein